MESLSDSTIKQYSSALKKWDQFCTENSIDFLDTTPKNVMKLLSDRYLNGESYGSLNSERSALSLISKNKVGEHLDVTRYMKGVSKSRPEKPKYQSTWDISIVLNYLEDLDVLSLENLTLKTVMLIALSTAQRAQTITKIKVNEIKEVPNGVEIRNPDCVKTSGPSKYQPFLQLPKFVTKPKLCVASTVLRYKEVTEPLRNNISQLFISYKKPIQAVCTPTISRWLKKCLARSGVDVSQFSAHSTRHASTSAASIQGIDIDTIRRTAGWSKRSKVFAKFYNRKIDKSGYDFTNCILEQA